MPENSRSIAGRVATRGPRLIMIGAVHVSQVLASLAPSAGFDTIVIDPRTAFATIERFRNVKVITEWPDTALLNIGLDRYTAIACLTHEPRIDDIALSMALRADCGYIGALGSAKSHSKRVERLENMGFSADDIERIHAPIGLDIGAASSAEIAVSILAEIVLSWRAKPLRSENAQQVSFGKLAYACSITSPSLGPRFRFCSIFSL